ncbi:helix-turn-helix domain-containing protein, partial [Marinobacter sp. OP 3.4]|uniref:helix-turn-helix domain-containing protein n=1 Tax=Marinobacter sp. OP 3.4 TaxID=3076501 RepID=UPI002E20ECEC
PGGRLHVEWVATFSGLRSDRERTMDVRIIAATNRAPEEEVANGNLREDLLYRLSVFPVEVPPLRHRLEDIPRLVAFFLERLNQADNQSKYLSPQALSRLQSHSWPGNLRELGNVIQRAYIMSDRCLTTDTLPGDIGRPGHGNHQYSRTLQVPIGSKVADVERDLILATLEQCGGRRQETARLLGLSTKTLYNRLQKYDRHRAAS